MKRKLVKGAFSCEKTLKTRGIPIATLRVKLFQPEAELVMRNKAGSAMSLHDFGGRRKYLNEAERKRFVKALRNAPPKERLFCLALMWSGCRLSELLALTPAAIDIETGLVAIETLKRRRRGVIRYVPLPPSLLDELERTFDLTSAQRDAERTYKRLWSWSRATAWRRVKKIMAAAGIVGSQAMPKGLRHSFGASATLAKVPLNIVQRWLGHASIKSTAVYNELAGPDEIKLASWVWGDSYSVHGRRDVCRMCRISILSALKR